jgi:hypothetical protein
VAAAPVAAVPTDVGARQPGAQRPGVPTQRPKVQKQAPSRTVRPGDLVCGECGEGNEPARKFCRRCGASLAEIVPEKKPGFFKRLFTRKPKEAAAAGSRPTRGGGGGSDVGRKARLAKGKALGGLASARAMLALLAMVGIGVGLVLPRPRSFITGVPNRVQNLISPVLIDAKSNPARAIATSNQPDAPRAVNLITNDHWAPDPGDREPAVAAVWDEPTRIDELRVYSGIQVDEKSFPANPRPKDVFFQILDDQDTITTKQVRLEDVPEQKFGFSFSNVVSVRAEILSCYQPVPDNPRNCAFTELNFLRKKR